MSPNHSWTIHSGGSAGTHSWLEIILLILIGLMIVILAYQGITYRSKNPTIKFGYVETAGELTKVLLINR